MEDKKWKEFKEEMVERKPLSIDDRRRKQTDGRTKGEKLKRTTKVEMVYTDLTKSMTEH